MTKYIFVLLLIGLAACGSGSDKNSEEGENKNKKEQKDSSKKDEKDKKDTKYDMSTVDVKDRKEFERNLEKIEKKHGEQWDFCTCVVKNDSINKAFSSPVSDAEFDRLSDRFDVIDKHCKAFLAQNPNQTPEERAKHEKKVKKCLKEAGVAN